MLGICCLSTHTSVDKSMKTGSHKIKWTLEFKGAIGLYKPAGGAGPSFCMISNILHIRDPFFKIKKYLQII